MQILGLLIGAGGVYGAIRADLAALHVRAAEALASAKRAHERIDFHLDRGQ